MFLFVLCVDEWKNKKKPFKKIWGISKVDKQLSLSTTPKGDVSNIFSNPSILFGTRSFTIRENNLSL